MPYDFNDAMYEAGDFVDEYLKTLEAKFREHSNLAGVEFTQMEQRQIEVLNDHLTETFANILFRINAGEELMSMHEEMMMRGEEG